MSPSTPWLPPRVGFARVATTTADGPPLSLLSLAASARAHGADPVLLEGRAPATPPSLVVVDGGSGSPREVQAQLESLGARYPDADLAVATSPGLEDALPLDLPRLRFVLKGDAEATLGELLGALRQGRREFRGVRGLEWRDGAGVLRREAERPLTVAPTEHPEPAWDLCPEELAPRVPRDHAPWLTSWTCPPSCPTCHGSFGRSVRRRDPQKALAEARRQLARGARGLAVLDEAFDHDPRAAARLLRGLIEDPGPTRLVFPRGLRAERIGPELAGLLAAAGLRRVTVEISSASPRQQRLLRAHRDLDATAASVAHLGRAGVFVTGVVHLGGPGEDVADRRAARTFARRAPFHRVRFVPASFDASLARRGHALPPTGLRDARRACRLATWSQAVDPRQVVRLARGVVGAFRRS